MSQEDYVKMYLVYAWLPKKTATGYVWFDLVKKIVDERPEFYLGLASIITYEKV